MSRLSTALQGKCLYNCEQLLNIRITQVVIGHSDRTRWQEFVKGSIINRLTYALRTIDILIVASAEEA